MAAPLNENDRRVIAGKLSEAERQVIRAYIEAASEWLQELRPLEHEEGKERQLKAAIDIVASDRVLVFAFGSECIGLIGSGKVLKPTPQTPEIDGPKRAAIDYCLDEIRAALTEADGAPIGLQIYPHIQNGFGPYATLELGEQLIDVLRSRVTAARLSWGVFPPVPPAGES